MHVAWALGLNSNKKDSKAFTAGSTTTYSTALLEKVFLHSSLGPPLMADPLTILKNPSTAGVLLPALSGGESLRKLCVMHGLLSRAAGKLGQISP